MDRRFNPKNGRWQAVMQSPCCSLLRSIFQYLIQGSSSVLVPALRPGLAPAHPGPLQHTHPLSCSFHFDNFGCQVETSRFFRALVNLPKSPPVDTKGKTGNGLDPAHPRNSSCNYSSRWLKIAQDKVDRIRWPAAWISSFSQLMKD